MASTAQPADRPDDECGPRSNHPVLGRDPTVAASPQRLRDRSQQADSRASRPRRASVSGAISRPPPPEAAQGSRYIGVERRSHVGDQSCADLHELRPGIDRDEAAGPQSGGSAITLATRSAQCSGSSRTSRSSPCSSSSIAAATSSGIRRAATATSRNTVIDEPRVFECVAIELIGAVQTLVGREEASLRHEPALVHIDNGHISIPASSRVGCWVVIGARVHEAESSVDHAVLESFLTATDVARHRRCRIVAADLAQQHPTITQNRPRIGRSLSPSRLYKIDKPLQSKSAYDRLRRNVFDEIPAPHT